MTLKTILALQVYPFIGPWKIRLQPSWRPDIYDMLTMMLMSRLRLDFVLIMSGLRPDYDQQSHISEVSFGGRFGHN